MAANRPSIPMPEYDLEEVAIKGRDGALHIDNKRYKPIKIAIEFNYICHPNEWMQIWRKIKKWLSAKNDKLSFADDPEYYYHVYYVTLNENSRDSLRTGKFQAVFVCAPYLYLKSGSVPKRLEFKSANLLDAEGDPLLDSGGAELYTTCGVTSIMNGFEICYPVYRIEGEGSCYLRVNENLMILNVSKNIVVDTELQAAYRDDGERVNQTAIGDYKELHLKPGKNEIIIDNAFDIWITPNWREL